MTSADPTQAMLRIATCNMSASKVTSEGEFIQRVEHLCSDAKDQDADIVVLPEYMMLAHLAKVTDEGEFSKRLRSYAELHSEKLLELLRTVGRRTKMSMITGTMPILDGGRIYNRSYLINHEGRVFHEQDKLMMTRFETERWQVEGALNGIKVFKWRGFRCAIAICYDIEFPVQLNRAFALNNGIDVIFVPSCTDAEQGYWRVRHCAAARAVEWQCVTVVSSLVGGIAEIGDMDTHYGRGAVFGPCDHLFPADGCLVETESNQVGIAMATVELTKLEQTRAQGSVYLAQDQIRQWERG